MQGNDSKEKGLTLVHSVPRERRQGGLEGSYNELPAMPHVYRLSAVLERVERQLQQSFSRASPHIKGRVVSTDSADSFVDELLAKALVRRFSRIVMRSSVERCVYAYENQDGLINAYTLARSFYMKVASRLRQLGGVDVATPNPVKRGHFRVGFERSPDWVEVTVASRLGDYGEFVSCTLLWKDAVSEA